MRGAELWHPISSDVITEAVAWRRHLHEHPELAYSEHETADFVAARLAEAGLTVHRGLAGTGVVGSLTRGTSRRTLAIRADMDGLPITEQTNAAHASRAPGVMHACGHDGHVAMALTAARVCARLPRLDGTVHFIFQPAEEGGAGARRMIEEGLFRLFPCDAVYALHNWPNLPVGACVALDGPMMAANAVFEITITGRGCHGAMPHAGTDALLAGSHLVCALQSIVSRNTDPLEAAVLSATQIHAGTAHNVIPERCCIRGTARWFDKGVGEGLERRILELSQGIAAGFACKAQVHFERRYPATVNDPAKASFVRAVAAASPIGLSVLNARPSMASEDFAFMLEAVPGCYYWLGSGRSGHDHGIHSPHYDFNDDVLPLGTALWVALVEKSLS